jgi:hypothetical protein
MMAPAWMLLVGTGLMWVYLVFSRRPKGVPAACGIRRSDSEEDR